MSAHASMPGPGRRSRGPRAALAALLVAAAGVLGPIASADAQPAGVTVNPAMARGPAAAPVTIVEFSDYQ